MFDANDVLSERQADMGASGVTIRYSRSVRGEERAATAIRRQEEGYASEIEALHESALGTGAVSHLPDYRRLPVSQGDLRLLRRMAGHLPSGVNWKALDAATHALSSGFVSGRRLNY